MLGKDRYYSQHRGWISGTGTSRAFLGGVSDVELPEPTEPVPAGDYIADPDATMHYFAVDRNGSLKSDRSSFEYFDVEAHIVELIPNSVSYVLKAHLRSVGVSYIIAGDDELDMAEAVRKIGEILNTEEIILGGGGTLNWSMLRQALRVELSLVLMPTANGERYTHSLFEANDDFATPAPYEFALKNVEALEDGSVWLRYDVVGEIGEA